MVEQTTKELQQEVKNLKELTHALLDTKSSRWDCVLLLAEESIPAEHKCPELPEENKIKQFLSKIIYDAEKDIWIEKFSLYQRQIHYCMFCGRPLPTKKWQKRIQSEYQLDQELIKEICEEVESK